MSYNNSYLSAGTKHSAVVPLDKHFLPALSTARVSLLSAEVLASVRVSYLVW